MLNVGNETTGDRQNLPANLMPGAWVLGPLGSASQENARECDSHAKQPPATNNKVPAKGLAMLLHAPVDVGHRDGAAAPRLQLSRGSSKRTNFCILAITNGGYTQTSKLITIASTLNCRCPGVGHQRPPRNCEQRARSNPRDLPDIHPRPSVSLREDCTARASPDNHARSELQTIPVASRCVNTNALELPPTEMKHDTGGLVFECFDTLSPDHVPVFGYHP